MTSSYINNVCGIYAAFSFSHPSQNRTWRSDSEMKSLLSVISISFSYSVSDKLCMSFNNCLSNSSASIRTSYAAFLCLLLFQIYSPRTSAIALRVCSLRSWPYKICEVHVRDLWTSRASLDTSSPLSQSRILALRSNVLFLAITIFPLKGGLIWEK